MAATEQFESVLVYVGLDRVGDGLLKLPFVRGLREAFPNAKITWLAGKETSVYASVLAPAVDGLLDEVIENAGIGLEPKELLRRPLEGRKFDLVIDSQRIFWASLSLWRIPHKCFISPAGRFLLSSKKPPSGYKFPKSMQRQLLDLLELASGQSFATPTKLDLDLDPDLDTACARLLPRGQDYVGLAPGAGGLPKCWPLDNFIAIAKQCLEKGRKPVFILGPAETDWYAKIKQAVPGALFPLQTDDIGQKTGYSPFLTIRLAGRLKAAVSNDSGVGHMLAIGGAPMVSLFGNTVPEKFMPMGEDVAILRAHEFVTDSKLMKDIPVGAVLEALERKLAP